MEKQNCYWINHLRKVKLMCWQGVWTGRLKNQRIFHFEKKEKKKKLINVLYICCNFSLTSKISLEALILCKYGILICVLIFCIFLKQIWIRNYQIIKKNTRNVNSFYFLHLTQKSIVISNVFLRTIFGILLKLNQILFSDVYLVNNHQYLWAAAVIYFVRAVLQNNACQKWK